jgi:MarR family transcriptional regulator, organic hydroperoxide resistance regulator
MSPDPKRRAHELRLYHRLQLAAHLTNKAADRAVRAATSLTVAQVTVLNVVELKPNATQRYVAAQLGVNESALAPMVKRLYGDGLLLRERSADDTRAWALRLSDSGRSILRTARRPFATINATIADALSDRQIRDLCEMLDLLIESFP